MPTDLEIFWYVIGGFVIVLAVLMALQPDDEQPKLPTSSFDI